MVGESFAGCRGLGDPGAEPGSRETRSCYQFAFFSLFHTFSHGTLGNAAGVAGEKLVHRLITLFQIQEYADVAHASTGAQFVDGSNVYVVDAEAGVPATLAVTFAEPGRYMVGCATLPEDTDTMHPAELIRVDGS